MFDITNEINRSRVESTEEWHTIAQSIPYLKFPAHWEVRIIPPFGGATARFTVRYEDKTVSIYLDHYSRLGCMDYPYWEIYPAAGGDTDRFAMENTAELIAAIDESLGWQIAEAEEESN